MNNCKKGIKYWCHKIIPLVYDESLSYYEVLCKLTQYINDMIDHDNDLADKVEELEILYTELKEYVDHYFDNLDVQEEINNKLDDMADSGELAEIILPYTNTFLEMPVNETYWVNENGQQTKIWYIITDKLPELAVEANQYGEIITNNNLMTASVNAGRFTAGGNPEGYLRKDGVTLHPNTSESLASFHHILGYKDGNLVSIPAETSTEDIDAMELDWAVSGFATLLENGVVTEYGQQETPPVMHPRSFIAQTSNDLFIVGSSDGRSYISNGLSYYDIVRFLQSLNYNYKIIYNLDGGTSCTFTRYGIRINWLIQNSHPRINNVIGFKSDKTFENDNLDSCNALSKQMAEALVNNNVVQGDLRILDDSNTHIFEFYSSDTNSSGHKEDSFIRFQPNRFYAGVNNDFSDADTAKLLLDIQNDAVKINEKAVTLMHSNYADIPTVTDEIPTMNTNGYIRVYFTDSTHAQNLGFAPSDYGLGYFFFLQQQTGNIRVALLRTGVYYSYQGGAWVKLN